MSRIIYGVSGEGSGHSSRASEILRHLLESGHEVRVVSYDRGYRNLSVDFTCLQIEGLRIVSVDNRVSVIRTLWQNLIRVRVAVSRLRELAALFKQFRPDCVITDFEPATAWFAFRRGLPLISLDNQHRMRYMEYKVPHRLRFEQWQTKLIIRCMIPEPDVALAITFFRGAVSNDRTFLFPPILRREVRALQSQQHGFHLVYLTGSYDSLIGLLKQFTEHRFRVYGYNRHDTDENLEYREFSGDGFLQDLAACQSVVATAGFTLISEAIHLGKPYLAFPMQGQFEQQLNALCLEELGLGMNAQVADRSTLDRFFAKLPELAAHAGARRAAGWDDEAHGGGGAIEVMLDRLLADDLGLLRQYQCQHRGRTRTAI